MLASMGLVAVVSRLLVTDSPASPATAQSSTGAAANTTAIRSDPVPNAPSVPVAPATVADPVPDTSAPERIIADDASIPTAPARIVPVADPAADTSAPRRPVTLTRAAVEGALKRRRADFDRCRPRYRQLRVTITAGRAALAEIDAMPYSGVGDDVCLRDGLRRIAFPRATAPLDFVVPLDLRRGEDRTR